MPKKNIFIGILALSTILMLNIFSMERKSIKADPICYGWNWLVNKNHKWVVRYNCVGGSYCAAEGKIYVRNLSKLIC